jgi:hypothetical protein
MQSNELAENLIQISSEVDVLEAKEIWSEYRLADGTLLRIKPVLIAVSRAPGYTPDGDPIYNMKSTLVTDVRAPQQLKNPV